MFTFKKSIRDHEMIKYNRFGHESQLYIGKDKGRETKYMHSAIAMYVVEKDLLETFKKSMYS